MEAKPNKDLLLKYCSANVCRAEMCKLEIHWSLLAKSENESAFSLLINAACGICRGKKKTTQTYEQKQWSGCLLTTSVSFYYATQYGTLSNKPVFCPQRSRLKLGDIFSTLLLCDNKMREKNIQNWSNSRIRHDITILYSCDFNVLICMLFIYFTFCFFYDT